MYEPLLSGPVHVERWGIESIAANPLEAHVVEGNTVGADKSTCIAVSIRRSAEWLSAWHAAALRSVGRLCIDDHDRWRAPRSPAPTGSMTPRNRFDNRVS